MQCREEVGTNIMVEIIFFWLCKGWMYCFCLSFCPYWTDRRELAGMVLTQQCLFRFAHLPAGCLFKRPFITFLNGWHASLHWVGGMPCQKILTPERRLPCPENKSALWTTLVFQAEIKKKVVISGLYVKEIKLFSCHLFNVKETTTQQLDELPKIIKQIRGGARFEPVCLRNQHP